MIDLPNIPVSAPTIKTRNRTLRLQGAIGLAFVAILALAGCSTSVKLGPQAVAGLTPDGTINMDQVQVAYIASGSGGHGTLSLPGRCLFLLGWRARRWRNWRVDNRG